MIVSHERKFIFLKTRKTASTSLEIALSRYCGDRDILTPIATDEGMRVALSGRGAQNYERPARSLSPVQRLRRIVKDDKVPLYTEHMTAVAARRLLGDEVWNSYFKFAVVRNPYDRMLSRFYWSMKARPGNREIWGIEALDQFLRYRAEYVNENWLIYTSGDRLLVDDVVRFENLEGDLGRISERIGIDHNVHDDMKSIHAKSDFRPKESGLGDIEPVAPGLAIRSADAAIIGALCAREIETFGYAPPSLRPTVVDAGFSDMEVVV